MRLRLLGLIAGLLILAALTGCGTPGAPSLPSLNLAAPVDDLTASRRGNKVDLDWTQPRKNTDRTNVKHNPTTLICRHEGTTLMAKCEIVAEVAPPTSKAAQKQKGEGPPGDIHIHFVDTLPPQLGIEHPAGFVMYAVAAPGCQTRWRYRSCRRSARPMKWKPLSALTACTSLGRAHNLQRLRGA
jgi:predicted small lipoprotein YifL